MDFPGSQEGSNFEDVTLDERQVKLKFQALYIF